MKQNLKRIVLALTIFTSLLTTGCSNDNDDDDLLGNWIRKSAFDGPARSSAVAFIIDNYVYIATGYTGDAYLKDLWVYNSEGDYWEQKADFTGIARSAASAFELDGNGYIGLGYDGTNKLKDFYQYNPNTNTWTQKADFAGTARYSAVGFQVGGKAFFGTGYDGNYLKDFYQYNPTADSWNIVSGFSGNKRRNATVFIIDDKAYLGTGINNGAYQTDFWMYDPTTEAWTKKRDLNDDEDDHDDYNIARSNAVSFSMDGLGYVGTGESSKTIWEYNPSTDLWKEKTALEGSGRTDALGISINNRGFIILGRSGSSYYDDCWEFKPQQEQDDDDN
ncbi:Kelch repeat-containing protein [Flavobacterium agrisoli]|uniref:Galactose oxidase n=1 Tax=Flavobacterium agrisoli TaxID=2793066 RepID=A0A934PPM0_9FLAO|nr:kelch repeat-containing protein [Flavobacterium agrisoli]MBK0370281.1 galactose oxidase [Flavobacterium agrisoli]